MPSQRSFLYLFIYLYIRIYSPLVERVTSCVQDRTKGKLLFLFTPQHEEHNEGKYLIWDPRELDTISLKVLVFHDTEPIPSINQLRKKEDINDDGEKIMVEKLAYIYRVFQKELYNFESL